MTWGYGLGGPLLTGLEEASSVPVPHAIRTLAFLIIRSGLLIRRKGQLGLSSLIDRRKAKGGMEEREAGKRRRQEEAAIAIAPPKRVERGNILCEDDKEIAIVEKRILTRDIHRRKTSGVFKNVEWSDFPMDLLMSVAERLTPADHVRMSTTCKSWQCAAPSFLFSKTPILLFIENNRSYFFDPLSKMKWVTCIPELLDATFHYSKDGWLLLSQNNNQSQFFFFNPFTNEKINLPNFYPNTLYKPPFDSFCKPGAFVVTFSSPPTSQNCVIFVISAMTYYNPHTHSTRYFYAYHSCSHKDTTWKWELKNETDGSDRFNDLLQTQPACYKNPLSFNGFFYYLNTKGTLAIIKLTKKTTMTQTVKKPRQLLPECEHYDCYLVESQGEILSIFCNGNKKIKVFQVDHSVVHNDCDEDKWIELKSLRDNLFFLDRLSSLSTVVKGGDMIYFPKFQRGCNDFEEPARRIWVDPNFILKTL